MRHWPDAATAIAAVPADQEWWCLAGPGVTLLAWQVLPTALDQVPHPQGLAASATDVAGISGWSNLSAGWLLRADYAGEPQLVRVVSAVVWRPDQPPQIIGDPPPPEWQPRTLRPALVAALQAEWSQFQHGDAVQQIRQRIAAGECYQVNLTLPFHAAIEGDALTVAQRLLRSDHAGFAAVIHRPGQPLLLCNSPECLWEVAAGGIRTRPIKGTRPRGQRDALEASAKEAAELAMIVDLMRNDLGRLAEPGSVRVPEPGATIDLPYVHHRVATVAARLRCGVTWRELCAALLPAGSITGTPKLRAMQVIRELEPRPRGAYCGTIGWIAADGQRSQANVAIRTATVTDTHLTIHAGGGIVADSDPLQEWDEAWAKTRAFAAVLA